ncbi:MAG: hypothetical protein CVU69_05245 [Deltaproteobacteria bacterium HGW-Deltaproteobacteria-4]|nr:MAG: hypothetical protein CVU69_05245 [Deltaproteobacteria bacterium HGW-Deltaproteobacteria-4]
MAKTHILPTSAESEELKESLTRGEKNLDILEVHEAELTAVEHNIQQDMKRKDREYKDSHFHSIPKPIKHTRP